MDIFETLWQQYSQANPAAKKIHDLLQAQGETIVNDHIALRTLNDPRVNLDILAKPFEKLGYQAKGQYFFKEKKLQAKHYELPDPQAPKVFISHLLLEEFSPALQETLRVCIDQLPENICLSGQLVSSAVHWQPLSYITYEQLLSESEYAAWFYAFGFCANHFTVNINALKNIHEIAQMNDFLIKNGYEMNTAGGAVKGSPAQCLEQSSTLAEKVSLHFEEGPKEIRSCYYEFAKRYKDKKGHLFQGFIEGSADKIFESTHNQ